MLWRYRITSRASESAWVSYSYTSGGIIYIMGLMHNSLVKNETLVLVLRSGDSEVPRHGGYIEKQHGSMKEVGQPAEPGTWPIGKPLQCLI